MTTKTKTTQTNEQLTKKVQDVINMQTTKSARIRLLDSMGLTRSEIAKALGIRYQHVRNVLITPLAGGQVSVSTKVTETNKS